MVFSRRVLLVFALLVIAAASVAWAQRFRVMEGPGMPLHMPPPHFSDGAFTICKMMYTSNRRDANGFGFQRVYNQRRDETVRVSHGDVVAVRDGFHPFVTAHGYDAYYLNVLAGERRSMAASDDPRYAHFRHEWPPPDPRLPLVAKPDDLN
jgi:hypothetical protein